MPSRTARTIALIVAGLLVAGVAVAFARGPEGGSRPSARTAATACPRALRPASGDAGRAVAAVRGHWAGVLSGLDLHGARVIAVFTLATPLPGLRMAVYAGPPKRHCGAEVTRRSWAVVVSVPNAPFANLQPAVVYVARTPTGWQPWLRAFPNAGTSEPLPVP